jgi:release factor glutamine methyltransferase
MIRTRFGSLSIITPPGVYAPRSDTALLAGEIGAVEGAHVLELCAGSGALALLAAQRGAARVLAVDCSKRAVLTTHLNARLNRLRVTARCGDLSNAIDPHDRFDVILANPPYLPTIGEGRTDDRWDAGPDGRAVLDSIIDQASDHLRPEGRLLLAQSALAGIAASTRRLLANGFHLIRSVEHHGSFGPIVNARRESLIRRGAMDAHDAQETLVVLTASIRPIEAHDV